MLWVREGAVDSPIGLMKLSFPRDKLSSVNARRRFEVFANGDRPSQSHEDRPTVKAVLRLGVVIKALRSIKSPARARARARALCDFGRWSRPASAQRNLEFSARPTTLRSATTNFWHQFCMRLSKTHGGPEMKAFFGVFGLLAVSAMVGILAVTELHAMTDAAGGPGAVISGTATGASAQPETQQQVRNSVEVVVNQSHPVQDLLDDD